MSEKILKPRLGYYKALLGYEKPDIERIVGYFLEWVSCVEYLIFRKENIHTWEKEYKAVKSAKRGNDVYAWKVRKGLDYLRKLPDYTFFNFKDRGRRQSTKAIFVTLTCRRDLSLDEAWERIGVDYNRWITGLRKQFGRIDVIRCWEAHKDGYPHIHCVLLFHDVWFETFFYNGVWRISEKRLLERYWPWGFSDIWAMYSLGAGVGYVMKYVTKVNEALLVEKGNQDYVLTLALLWIFKKRSFSVSRGFGVFLVEEKDEGPRGQVDLEGNTIYRWVLVGFWASNMGCWSKELSYNEFWRIRASEYFTFNKVIFYS